MEIQEWNEQLAEKLIITKSIDANVVNHYLTYCNEKKYNLGQILIRSNRISATKLKTVLCTSLSENTTEHDNELAQLVKEENKSEELSLDGKTFGEYDVISEIARGGMGIVYRAKKHNTDDIVALKILLKTNIKALTSIKRFIREAKLTASLHHPNIIPIYDIGEQDGYNFFTMKYVEGMTFQDMINNPNVSLEEKLSIFVRVCDAVQYAHDHKVIHRDLKPSNILLDSDNTPYITDFGLAKFIDSATMLTQSGTALGTPVYMSPEQAKGIRNIDYRTDIYSLGIILFQILSNGAFPFRAATLNDLYYKIIETLPLSPTQFNPYAPKVLIDICMRALEKNPKDRYKTAHAFMNKIQAYLRNEKVVLHKVPLKSKLIKLWLRYRPFFLTKEWLSNNKMLCMASGLIIFLCICIGITSYDLFTQKPYNFTDIIASLKIHDYDSALSHANEVKNKILKVHSMKDKFLSVLPWRTPERKIPRDLHVLFAKIYYAQERYEEAKKEIDKAKNKKPDYNTFKISSLIYEAEQDFRQALKESNEYISKSKREIVQYQEKINTLQNDLNKLEEEDIIQIHEMELEIQENEKKLVDIIEQYYRFLVLDKKNELNASKTENKEYYKDIPSYAENKKFATEITNKKLNEVYNLLSSQVNVFPISEEVMQDFEKNLRIYHFYPKFHKLASEVYERLGNYSKALDHIAYVLEDITVDEKELISSSLSQIDLLIKEDDLKEATEQLKKLKDSNLKIETLKESRKFKQLDAQILMHNKQYQDALKLYEELYNFETAQQDNVINIIRCCYYDKDYDNLKSKYEQYADVIKNLSSELRGEVDYYYSMSYDSNKEKILLLEKIKQDTSFYSKIELELGKLYSTLKESHKTLHYLEKYWNDESFKNNLELYDTLGRTYMRMRGYREAVDAWSRCIQIVPWEKKYYFYRILAYSFLLKEDVENKDEKSKKEHFDKEEKDIYKCMQIDPYDIEPLLIFFQSIIDTEYYYKIIPFASNLEIYLPKFKLSQISLYEEEDRNIDQYIKSIITNEQVQPINEEEKQQIQDKFELYPYINGIATKNVIRYLKKFYLNDELYKMIQEKINISSGHIKNLFENLKKEIEKEYVETQKGYFCNLLFRYYISKDEQARAILDTNIHIVSFLQYFVKQTNEPFRLRFFAMRMLWDLQRGDSIQWLIENRNLEENQINLFIYCILSQFMSNEAVLSSILSENKKYNNFKLSQEVSEFFEKVDYKLDTMNEESKLIVAQYTNNKKTLHTLLKDESIPVQLTAASHLKELDEKNSEALKVLEQYLSNENELYQLYSWVALWSWSWDNNFDPNKISQKLNDYQDYKQKILDRLNKGNIKNITLQRLLLYILRYFPDSEVTNGLDTYLTKIQNDTKWTSEKNILAFQIAEFWAYYGNYQALQHIVNNADEPKKLSNSSKTNKRKKSKNSNSTKNTSESKNKDMMFRLGALTGIHNACLKNGTNIDKGELLKTLKAFLQDDPILYMIYSYAIGLHYKTDAKNLKFMSSLLGLLKQDEKDTHHIKYICILLMTYASNSVEYLKFIENGMNRKIDFWNDSSDSVRFLMSMTYNNMVAFKYFFNENDRKKLESLSKSQQKCYEKIDAKDFSIIQGAISTYENVILNICYRPDKKNLYDLETLKFRISCALYDKIQYINYLTFDQKVFWNGHFKNYSIDIKDKKNILNVPPAVIKELIDRATLLNSLIEQDSQNPLYELLQCVYRYAQGYIYVLKNKELDELLEKLKKLKEQDNSEQESVYDFWLAHITHDKYLSFKKEEYFKEAIYHINEFLYKYPWQLEANLEKESLLTLFYTQEKNLLEKKQKELEKFKEKSKIAEAEAKEAEKKDKEAEAKKAKSKEAEKKAKEAQEKAEMVKEQVEAVNAKIEETEKMIKNLNLKIDLLKKEIKFYQDRIELIQKSKVSY